MDKNEIANRLRVLVAKVASGRIVTTDSKLCADLDFDSLDSVELVMDIEEEFAIEIPDADWEGGPDRTVADVVDLIATKLEEKGASHVRA